MTYLESSCIENVELASYMTFFPVAVGAKNTYTSFFILTYHKLPLSSMVVLINPFLTYLVSISKAAVFSERLINPL